MVKDLSPKVEKAQRIEAEHRELLGMIEETRATPEQYGQALDYIRLVNSPRLEDKEMAYQVMQREMVALAQMLGKPIPGADMTTEHPDLAAAVQRGTITQEHANELAAARAQQQFQRRSQAAEADAAAAERARQNAVRAAVSDLNTLEANLRSTDPHYAAKRQILIPTLKPIMRQLPPGQWARAFAEAYRNLPAPVAPVASGIPPSSPTGASPVGGNQPLRAGNPSGAATPQPKTLLDAINLGIESAPR